MSNNILIRLFFLLIVLTSCRSQVVNTVEPQVNQPEEGKATATGRVLSEATNEPLGNVIIRLAEVFREEESSEEGAYVLDVAFSPGDITDEEGYFAVENFPAGEYVLIVGDVYDQHKVIADDDGLPRIWDAKPDEILKFGEILVDIGGAATP